MIKQCQFISDGSFSCFQNMTFLRLDNLRLDKTMSYWRSWILIKTLAAKRAARTRKARTNKQQEAGSESL